MRASTVWVLVGLVGCGGEPASTPTPSATSAAPSPSSASTAPTPTPTHGAGTGAAAADADPADCERVRPCAEAFAAVAPAELAGPARIAAEQLDHSLEESPARAGACTAALASFRADLERLEIEVPEACARSLRPPPS